MMSFLPVVITLLMCILHERLTKNWSFTAKFLSAISVFVIFFILLK